MLCQKIKKKIVKLVSTQIFRDSVTVVTMVAMVAMVAMDTMVTTDTMVNVEAIEATETIEAIETIESTEAIETIETTEVTEAIGTTEAIYMSYRNLEIWQSARQLTIDVHKMTLQLPKFEMYEEGSQLRRSIKSVRSNIVEGYGRRRYKNDYVRFIIYSLSSNDESIDHLETLHETGSLQDEELFMNLKVRMQKLGIKINNFLQVISK